MMCATKHRLSEGELITRVLARTTLYGQSTKPAEGMVMVLPVLEKYICYDASRH
jgi:hypothetical protein